MKRTYLIWRCRGSSNYLRRIIERETHSHQHLRPPRTIQLAASPSLPSWFTPFPEPHNSAAMGFSACISFGGVCPQTTRVVVFSPPPPPIPCQRARAKKRASFGLRSEPFCSPFSFQMGHLSMISPWLPCCPFTFGHKPGSVSDF